MLIRESASRHATGTLCSRYVDYETRQREAAKQEIAEYTAALESWEVQCSVVKGKIREESKGAKDSQPKESTEEVLYKLQEDKPEPPQVPRLIYIDITPEELKWCLAKKWPSGGVISSEAGMVLGSHGMGKDSIVRCLSTFNQLWDGLDIATDRRTSESFTVRGARLTIGLQVQEATLKNFFRQSGELARGTGFLPRFLIAWPLSTQGFRPFTEAPDNMPALAKLNKRIAEVLEQPLPFDEYRILAPSIMCFSADAKAAWIEFYNAIENELRPSGELFDVRDVASKVADNTARMAANFQYFEDCNCREIGLEIFEGAARINAWHLHEALRLYSGLPITEDQANLEQLDDWLRDWCEKHDTDSISRREVQNLGPSYFRQDGKALDAALEELQTKNRVRLVEKERKRILIQVNPKLLKREGQ